MSRLSELVETGDRLILTGEAPTVDGGGLSEFNERIRELAHWVDALNATDNPAAHAHASNVAVAIALMRAGVEPVLQVACRDRNRIALQADIVGAALHGVENVLCITGDDVTAGDEPEAARVFDLDAPALARLATGLSEGHYLSGRPIEPAPRLFVGAIENAAVPPLEDRAQRAATKILAGARFLQLQISYYPDRLHAFIKALEERGLLSRVALLPAIVLVKSARGLTFMDRKVPGISVPEETIERVERAADEAEAAYELALEQARETLAIPGVRGLHLTDFRRDGTVSRLCQDLGIASKEERRAHADRSQLSV